MSYDKKIINYNFSSKVSEYNTKANIQKKVAKKLCNFFIENYVSKNSEEVKILDLGSGTSFVAKQFLKNNDNYKIYELDLSLNMLNNFRKNREKIIKICGDIENLPFAESSFDAIISSFSLQWIKDFENLFNNLNKILKPNGILAFSIPDDKSFDELKNIPFLINSMPSSEKLSLTLQENRFSKKLLINEKIYEKFSNIIEALKSFKKIGVNYYLPSNNKFNFKDLRIFYLKNYKNNFICKMSWSISYFIYSKND